MMKVKRRILIGSLAVVVITVVVLLCVFLNRDREKVVGLDWPVDGIEDAYAKAKAFVDQQEPGYILILFGQENKLQEVMNENKQHEEYRFRFWKVIDADREEKESTLIIRIKNGDTKLYLKQRIEEGVSGVYIEPPLKLTQLSTDKIIEKIKEERSEDLLRHFLEKDPDTFIKINTPLYWKVNEDAQEHEEQDGKLVPIFREEWEVTLYSEKYKEDSYTYSPYFSETYHFIH